HFLPDEKPSRWKSIVAALAAAPETASKVAAAKARRVAFIHSPIYSCMHKHDSLKCPHGTPSRHLVITIPDQKKQQMRFILLIMAQQ
ncbi:MAG: hypothetical protein AAF636_27870, partial [Pseudomonadota bacterium]